MANTPTGRRRLLQAGAAAAFAAATAFGTSANAQQRAGRTYVLVHGAWFGGWCWKQVADSLRALGHTVYSPTLTGLGERKHLARPGINLDTHVDDVVNLIETEDLRNVVLVGWSYGGMVVTDVLARVQQRIASMVYLDAFAPERGRSATSYTARNPPEQMIQLVAGNKDIPPLALKSLAVDDQAVTDYCVPRLAPHPVLTFLQASKAMPERPDIPHTYVLAGAYAKISQTFKPFYDMFEQDKRARVHVVDTGHVMMMTDPAGTLDILKNAR
ncbi:Non-heme chloroperoxidase (plasmid) [Variovorax sp. SRS16]|uniref:alpha/beta fold hydrolase n=1 Tax=Variovorax sp. SRS16 TaxID=282217 RepID=UPI0013198D36|nr:alpha/beta hydrolase [Variovorax sp. SRS16]VTU45304.1 Non-heme chloroperoxidase [Variovorax sp. SRS16]